MVINGEVLIDTVTLSFTVSGQRNEWAVSIKAPHNVSVEDETVEASWFPLLNELIADAYTTAFGRRFPERIRAQR
jgi:hypothetical protein